MSTAPRITGAQIDEARRTLLAARRQRAGETAREKSARLLERRIAQAILVIEDQPGDYYRRACPQCGAGVKGYLLPGGGEVIRCDGGHTIAPGRALVVEN